MSHNNYKKMIFQQTINWLTDLISHNLLCKLVYWLCYLIKASHTHCYLVFSWMKDVYVDFGLAGYSILAPMDRTLESKWSDPVNHLLRFVSRNRISRRDLWRMISRNSRPKRRLQRGHGEATDTIRNAILSDCLNFSLKNLTESEEPSMDSFPLHRLELKAMIPSLFGI